MMMGLISLCTWLLGSITSNVSSMRGLQGGHTAPPFLCSPLVWMSQSVLDVDTSQLPRLDRTGEKFLVSASDCPDGSNSFLVYYLQLHTVIQLKGEMCTFSTTCLWGSISRARAGRRSRTFSQQSSLLPFLYTDTSRPAVCGTYTCLPFGHAHRLYSRLFPMHSFTGGTFTSLETSFTS